MLKLSATLLNFGGKKYIEIDTDTNYDIGLVTSNLSIEDMREIIEELNELISQLKFECGKFKNE